jgi:hypothetical protein
LHLTANLALALLFVTKFLALFSVQPRLGLLLELVLLFINQPTVWELYDQSKSLRRDDVSSNAFECNFGQQKTFCTDYI